MGANYQAALYSTRSNSTNQATAELAGAIADLADAINQLSRLELDHHVSDRTLREHRQPWGHQSAGG